MIEPATLAPATELDAAPTLSPARLLARASAWLVVLGLATGGLVSGAMTGKLPADPHTALASHLNALLGALLMLGVAWTLPMLRYSAVGQRRLAWGFILANYANWFVTAVKAFLHVSGVDRTGEPRNDAIFAALTLFVVLPSLASALAWAWGFNRR